MSWWSEHLKEEIPAGQHADIGTLLRMAADDPDCRQAARELGRFLKEDGAWRGEIKRAGAWTELEAFIEKHRTAAPWWEILKYADGKPVDAAAEAFFTEKS
jgi:hypothetical protein